MKTTNLLLIAAIIGLTAPHPARAGWTNDPWNGMAPVCTALWQQYYPKPVALSGGRFLVTWMDDRLPGDNVKQYYQILDYDGRPLRLLNGDSLFSVNSVYGGQVAISDRQGGCIIVVFDNRNGTWDIYGQRLDSLGNRLWGSTGLPVAIWTSTLNDAAPSSIASDSLGNFFVGWYVGWPDANVYVQKFNVNGQRLWGDYGAPACTDPHSQFNAQLVPDDQGGVVAAWKDNRHYGSDIYEPYFQHLDAAGNPLLMVNGIPLRQASGEPLGAAGLAGISDGQGGSIWHCTGSTSSPNFYDIVRVDGSGRTIWHFWNMHALWVHTPHDLQLHQDGTFYSSVEESRPGGYGIFVYHFDVNGNQMWGTLGHQLGLALTPTSNGVIGSSDVSHGQIYGKQAVRNDSSGSQTWVSPYALGTTPNVFWVSSSVSDGADGAVFPIQLGSDFGDIYAQRVNSDGALGTPHKTRLNPAKTIESVPEKSSVFILEKAGSVKIEVFDVQGRKVFTRDEGVQQPGPYTLRTENWDLPSGVYMVKVLSAHKEQIKSIVITH